MFKIILLIVIVYGDVYMVQQACGGQRTMLKDDFLPPVWIWGIELGWTGLHGKCFWLLSHGTCQCLVLVLLIWIGKRALFPFAGCAPWKSVQSNLSLAWSPQHHLLLRLLSQLMLAGNKVHIDDPSVYTGKEFKL